MMIYTFDGTLCGLLTAIFESFDRKQSRVKLITKDDFAEPDLFREFLEIISDHQKAGRVWKGLETKAGKEAQRQFYGAFLSEDAATYQHLFDYARYIFTAGHAGNFGNEHVLAVSRMHQQVHREKHRMEAFVRFQKSGDGMYFSVVNPDFNVLPLILRHFKNRYADQPWIIYDEKRKYGIHYDLQEVHEITLELSSGISSGLAHSPVQMDEKEQLYTTLWKDYFKSTNIVERKNMKLHIRHVPKRYWRYLTEKEGEMP